jgi:hypothetical protein
MSSERNHDAVSFSDSRQGPCTVTRGSRPNLQQDARLRSRRIVEAHALIIGDDDAIIADLGYGTELERA